MKRMECFLRRMGLVATMVVFAGCGRAGNSGSPGKLDDAIRARTEVTVLQSELAASALTQESRGLGSSTSHALRKIIARAESKQEEGNIWLTKDRYADAANAYQESTQLYRQGLDWDKVEKRLSKAELSASTARMLAEATAKPEELKEGEKLQINAAGYLEAGDVELTIAEYEKARKAYEALVPGEGPATLEQAVAARTASLAALDQLENMAGAPGSGFRPSDGEKPPKPGSLTDVLQRANRTAMAASGALEERQYTPARALFAAAEKLFREAAALQGKRNQVQASRQSVLDTMKLADAAFKTDARPASFELGKQALADADSALAEDDPDAAKPLLTQAAEQFATARAEAEQFNALADARQTWDIALAGADEELLNKHAAAPFRAAKAKADEAQARASIPIFQEATTALNSAMADAKTKENAAKAGPIIARLDAALAAKEKFRAEDILAELENLIPTDARMEGLREKVSALPGPKKKFTVVLGGGVAMDFVLIRPGSFMMGSEAGANDEKPVYKVTITRPFCMGKYEVTQEQWEKVMGNNPSSFKGPKLPVENVSWNDCQAFMAKLREKAPGLDFRLPTEAQWEYACRAGTATAYSFGDADGLLGEYAWYSGNAGGKTHEVGGLKPNAWGLHDMHGNVWEWCLDWYGSYSSGDASDPAGASSGSYRVGRGGSWDTVAGRCRSAVRGYDAPGYRYYGGGFRVLLPPGQ